MTSKRTSRRLVKRRTSRLARNGKSSRRSTQNKDVRRLIDLAESQGWAIETTCGNHLRFIPPDPTKPMVHTSSTPSDRRAVQNLEAQLRKSGLIVAKQDDKKSPKKNPSSEPWLMRDYRAGMMLEFILGDRNAGVPPGTLAVVDAVRGGGLDVTIMDSHDRSLVGERVAVELVYEKDGRLHRTTPDQLALYWRTVE